MCYYSVSKACNCHYSRNDDTLIYLQIKDTATSLSMTEKALISSNL